MSLANPAEQIVRVVRAADPRTADRAVDWKAMGGFNGAKANQYRRERLASLLVLKDGQKPVEFALTRVCSTFFWRKLQGIDTGLLHELAVRAGVVSVSMPDGSTMRPGSTEKSDGQDVADVEWFKLLGRKFGEATTAEMAALILRLAQVPEDETHPFGSSDGLDLAD